MCLAIHAEIESIQDKHAYVTSMGVRQKVNIQLLDTVKPGDFVLVHAGFAIEKITADDYMFLERAYQEIENQNIKSVSSKGLL